MSGGSRNPVKIVIINTQYVETDSNSFKSVVQRLTGKDSTVLGEPMSESSFPSNRTARSEGIQSGSRLSRDLSFKEFDRLLRELPPMDELYRLWAE
ncbi:hypothetical protein L1049_000064 [Liquidambar formosana]|uniref:VQ domain-containing protein n=1 Tax=Liquidambar formosana TaxID=63359 RepID=A0AAP0N9S1_LIQFO